MQAKLVNSLLMIKSHSPDIADVTADILAEVRQRTCRSSPSEIPDEKARPEEKSEVVPPKLEPERRRQTSPVSNKKPRMMCV